MSIRESELILNADGSIYHVNLLPEDISDTIITVGDPDRVADVSKHFDHIELKKGKREFITHTGTLNGTRLTVISTGIGTDNIDIVLNELDALANIDLKTKTIKSTKKKLHIIRIGTSGAVQPDIAIDSFLISEISVGLDGLLNFYDTSSFQNKTLADQVNQHCNWDSKGIFAYAFNASEILIDKLISNRIRLGITVTNAGFYGPQGRTLRLKPALTDFHEKLTSFRFGAQRITNLEMETAGIYGLASLLGHHAISMNAILANRATGEFSKNPSQSVDALITYCLDKLTSS